MILSEFPTKSRNMTHLEKKGAGHRLPRKRVTFASAFSNMNLADPREQQRIMRVKAIGQRWKDKAQRGIRLRRKLERISGSESESSMKPPDLFPLTLPVVNRT